MVTTIVSGDDRMEQDRLNRLISQAENELTAVRARTTVPRSVDAAETAFLEARLEYRVDVLHNIREGE